MSDEAWDLINRAKGQVQQDATINSCINNKVLFSSGREGNVLHSQRLVECGIYLLRQDGTPEQIGKTLYCVGGGFDEAKNMSWECAPKPSHVKRFQNWPKDWKGMKSGYPVFWFEFGWHFVRLFDGRIINLNDCSAVPPYREIEDLHPKAQKYLRFRARHDPDFPEAYRDDFGSYRDSAIVKAAVVGKGV